MIFASSAIPDVLKITLEPHHDERGFFARTFCTKEMEAAGIPAVFEQSSLSYNIRRGILRGMHFQANSSAETKLVRCVEGEIFDVAIDLRPSSPTYCQWVGENLSARNGIALFIPPGFAHGFVTLEDNSTVLYQITPAFKPGLGLGVRWNDPAFRVSWPIKDPVLSERDANYPDWQS